MKGEEEGEKGEKGGKRKSTILVLREGNDFFFVFVHL